MEKTLLNLGKLSRTGIRTKIENWPSTNYVVYTLTVEHIDVNIIEARSQRQMWKTSAMQNLCTSENDKICHVPDVARGRGRVVSVSGHSSSDSSGHCSAVLQGWMGGVAGFPGKPTV